MKRLAMVLMLGMASMSEARAACSSIAASGYGGWKPVVSAPRDGTVVEMLETFGLAPWYGLFSWTGHHVIPASNTNTGTVMEYDGKPEWVSVDKPGTSVIEDSCLFWRPYKKPTDTKYVDPTGGAQDSVAYQCAYMHVPYDPKTGYCKVK